MTAQDYCVAIVANSAIRMFYFEQMEIRLGNIPDRLGGTGKVHLVVRALGTKDPTAVPAMMLSPCQTELLATQRTVGGCRVLFPLSNNIGVVLI